ncbi:ovaries absent isoform X1 [Colletes latitarsis]|uniref:ovaries absent isoform X1 n=1 Tax=Colletes latitarsis TaxID=2605962 RepID=UPI004035ED1F
MRFSTLQEQEYGVDLPQDQVLSDTHRTVMATTDNIALKHEDPVEEGSVVSNLPLLFANGYPTSLEKITLVQLERFVSFMVQCSLGHDNGDVISEPRWWPKEVKFSNPLTRPNRVNENWMANLKKLVFRCYTYHRSEYLLRFCSYLARYPHEDLEYVNNWDSTTSLYHKTTGKLLVTFRNENMNYDKRNESPRKKLLSCSGVAFCNSSKLKLQQHPIAMVEPPVEDIYLCDNCDAEFVGLEKMKEHERTCREQQHSGGNSRSITPDVLVPEPELSQYQFLDYFRLCSSKAELKLAESNKAFTINNNTNEERTSRRVRGSINFTRCPTIPFSSPAGVLLAKKSKVMTEETQLERLERIERHLMAPVLQSSCKPKWLEAEFGHDRWIVTYKPNREKLVDDYVHQYKFVNSVKRKPMLSIQSQLLYIACRPVYVLLTHLTQGQIHDLKQHPPKCRRLVRRVTIDDKESMTEDQKKIKPNVPSKRKAPTDESDSNVMEKSEETISNEASVRNLIVFEVTKSCDENDTTVAIPIKETTLCPKSMNRVTVIDLCSSDEDEGPVIPAPSDENRDPLSCIDEDVTKSLLQKLSSTTFRMQQTTEWIADNILSNGSENCTSEYRSTMLNTHTNLSPIIRPAP